MEENPLGGVNVSFKDTQISLGQCGLVVFINWFNSRSGHIHTQDAGSFPSLGGYWRHQLIFLTLMVLSPLSLPLSQKSVGKKEKYMQEYTNRNVFYPPRSQGCFGILSAL